MILYLSGIAGTEIKATPSAVTAIDSHPHLAASDLPVVFVMNHLQSTVKIKHYWTKTNARMR